MGQILFLEGVQKNVVGGSDKYYYYYFFFGERLKKKLHLMTQTDRPPDRWTTEDGDSLTEKMDKVVELVGGGSVVNGAYPV